MSPDECRPVEITVDGQSETIRVHGGVPMSPEGAMGIFVVGPVSEAGMEWVDARWIAALSPSVAEPLAAWLLEEAHALEELTPSHIPSHAVAFALEGQDG